MLTLFSYPELFGLADNNPYGLKIFAFLKLSGLSFQHQHVFDASAAPRSQLPYVTDGETTVGDSDTIIEYLIGRYELKIDHGWSAAQRRTDLFVRRTLDDLYWVMSYSRWRDPRYWPSFSAALLREHPSVTQGGLEQAQRYNFQRYHYQGIGRFEPEQVYARGVADLAALSEAIGDYPFLFGATVRSTDAGVYGFLANIYYYPIETPLRAFLVSKVNLVSHCERVHALVSGISSKT
jgi:glutathione S-transferase